jgi:signal peptidase I
MASKPQQDLQKVHRRRKNRESFLETLESIVVAFVLAFIFRAFVVEAFVIPTGSMGPTLYGQHAEFTCSDCGYEFAVGADGRLDSRPVCPNCGLQQPLTARTPLYSGDRILVLKFLYDFAEPQRWDVLVFRNPNEPEENYIKRLVGLPGETIELVRGDVTIDGRIARKTDRAQEALWMIVHDTRHEATRTGWPRPWIADRLWTAADHGFALPEAPPAGQTAWLVYQHRNTRGQRDNIRDYYAYNSGANGWRMGRHVCTDLRLRTEVTAETAESVLVVEMRAYHDRFRFVLPAEGSEAGAQILLNGKGIAESEGGVLPVGRAARVEVANVDHALVLRVNGRRVTTTHRNPTTRQGDVAYEPQAVSRQALETYHNPPGPDRPPPMAHELRVGAQGGPLRLAYLGLDRDVYYINETIHTDGESPGHGTEGNPFALRADEFFVCGDNSPKSFDCRLWPLDRPVVPRRNLVGKAFFVYWPAAGTRWHIPLAPDPRGWRLVH